MSTQSHRGADRPLIICHDGSREADEALEHAARLLPGARVLVVTLWRPLAEEGLSPAARPPASDPEDSGDVSRRAATQIAAEAARRASAAGLDAEPLPVEARGPLWSAIEAVAARHDALLVVCGTNRSGMRATLPGNLANSLVMRLSRPVLVVPSAKAVVDRRREAEERTHRSFAAQRR
jgi:nucleotide-binding universal stress UspA family protein